MLDFLKVVSVTTVFYEFYPKSTTNKKLKNKLLKCALNEMLNKLMTTLTKSLKMGWDTDAMGGLSWAWREQDLCHYFSGPKAPPSPLQSLTRLESTTHLENGWFMESGRACGFGVFGGESLVWALRRPRGAPLPLLFRESANPRLRSAKRPLDLPYSSSFPRRRLGSSLSCQ